MTYRRRNKPAARKWNRDPLTGNPVSSQMNRLLDLNEDEYLDSNDHFDLEKFNEWHNEKCDQSCVTSMAALVGYSKRHFEKCILPVIHTHQIGNIIHLTVTASLEAGTEEYRRRQAAKQSEAGKQHWGNIGKWGNTDPSSGSND